MVTCYHVKQGWTSISDFQKSQNILVTNDHQVSVLHFSQIWLRQASLGNKHAQIEFFQTAVLRFNLKNASLIASCSDIIPLHQESNIPESMSVSSLPTRMFSFMLSTDTIVFQNQFIYFQRWSNVNWFWMLLLTCS